MSREACVSGCVDVAAVVAVMVVVVLDFSSTYIFRRNCDREVVVVVVVVVKADWVAQLLERLTQVHNYSMYDPSSSPIRSTTKTK